MTQARCQPISAFTALPFFHFHHWFPSTTLLLSSPFPLRYPSFPILLLYKQGLKSAISSAGPSGNTSENTAVEVVGMLHPATKILTSSNFRETTLQVQLSPRRITKNFGPSQKAGGQLPSLRPLPLVRHWYRQMSCPSSIHPSVFLALSYPLRSKPVLNRRNGALDLSNRHKLLTVSK